jgi:AbrB family looped-hinge helix DNA binding protein
MTTDTQVETVCFSTRGQVVIPRRLRRKFEIQQGTRAIVYEEGDHIVIKPMTKAYLKSLRGSLKGTGLLKALTGERHRGLER